jgi:hypothetical protein
VAFRYCGQKQSRVFTAREIEYPTRLFLTPLGNAKGYPSSFSVAFFFERKNMIATLIKFVLGNYGFSFLVVGLLGALFSVIKNKPYAIPSRVFEAFLSYYCLFPIGFHFLYNFVMHVFFSAMAARFIGWQTSPFQKEVGFASLGFGIVGLLGYRKDFGLRIAAVTGPAFFLWGAAAGHLYQMIAHHNFSPGNAGMVFWTDIFLPVIGFLFLAGWRRYNVVPVNAEPTR